MADLGVALYTLAGIILFLALSATTLRCITRIYVVKAFGVDDWLMIVTLGLYIHYCAWVFYARSLVQGRRISDVPQINTTHALRAFFISEATYILVSWTLKLSIGTFLLRIKMTRVQTYIIYAMLFIITSYTTALFIINIFQCKPVAHFWHPESPGTCIKTEALLATGYAQSAIIASSDFGFAILPIFVIWKLQMDRFTKFSACGLISVGALAGVTTLLRVPYIKDLGDRHDFLHSTTELAILSLVEPGLGIIIGSAAATRPLFRLFFSKYHPFVSLTPAAAGSAPKSSNTTTTAGARSSAPLRRNIGHPIPMETFDPEGGDIGNDIGMKVLTKGGRVKRVCDKCASDGDCVHESRRTSAETHGSSTLGGDRLQESVIYKSTAVEWEVEYLPNK